jgi:hypothetical protein
MRHLVAAALSIGALACAPPLHAQDSAETVARCLYDIGEFGTEAVDVCVKQDLAAEKALKGYPPEAAGAVAGCTARMKAGGWTMVQRCVDRTLAGAPDRR